MRFEIAHSFDAPLAAVETAVLSEPFLAFLRANHSQMKEIEPLSIDASGDLVRRKVRYQPKPIIEKIGPKRVPPEWMAWVEESTYDRRRHTLDFRNVPVVRRVADHMENRGTMRFVAEGASRTRRTLEGELKVKVFVLGAIAERIIYSQAQGLLAEEARLLGRFLRENPAPPAAGG
jgi:hypothetical protein